MDFETSGVKMSIDARELSDEHLTSLAQEIADAAHERGLVLPFAAGSAAVDGAMEETAPAVEAQDPDLETTSFASESVWELMSHEQQTKAIELRRALAAGPLAEHGVTEASLRVVAVPPKEKYDKTSFVLLHTGEGIDVSNGQSGSENHSYNLAMSQQNDSLFQVEVNGVVYDSRTGMTVYAYDAKVADALENGLPLIDNQGFANENGSIQTFTLMTGSKLSYINTIAVRWVRDGHVSPTVTYPTELGDDDGVNPRWNFRICPAVVID